MGGSVAGGWHLACDLLSSGAGPGAGGAGVVVQLAKPDLTAMPSTRVLAALAAEHRANDARRAATLATTRAAAARHIRALRLAKRRKLARAVRAHFMALAKCEQAVRDALPLAIQGGVVWANPKAHEPLAELLKDINPAPLSLSPPVIKLKLYQQASGAVIRARAADAQARLRALQHAFDKAKEANRIMQKVADPVRTELSGLFDRAEEEEEGCERDAECEPSPPPSLPPQVDDQVTGNETEIRQTAESKDTEEPGEVIEAKNEELVDDDVGATHVNDVDAS